MNTNSQPKHIVYLITKGNFGGAQRYVYELALASQATGHNVTVVCGEPGLLIEKLESAGIKTKTLHNIKRDISLGREFASLSELYRVLRELKPDVLHLNSSKAGALGSLVARTLRIPNIIFTAHGWPFFEKRSWYWRTLAWAGSYVTTLLSHRTIVVSDTDYHGARQPGLKRKLIRIHTGITPPEFIPRITARHTLFEKDTELKRQNDLWVVSIAELTANKNLHTAVAAVIAHNETSARKIFYTIIGGGELEESLRTQIKEHDATSYIHVAGYVADARLLLKGFDVFLLPSHKEGLPYALLEAGAAGLGVIASNVGGIPEVITHTETGMLCDPDEAESITTELAHMSKHDLAEKLGANLERHVKENFSLEKMITKTLELY